MPAHKKHGMARTRIYRVWTNMNARCHDPGHQAYARYGGRGITVCDEWRGPGGFERWYAYVGDPPGPEYSLERIKNDRGYEPGNVKWATPAEQNRNKRNNTLLTYDDGTGPRTQSMTAWAEEKGLPWTTLQRRLINKWTIERALTTPRRNQPLHHSPK